MSDYCEDFIRLYNDVYPAGYCEHMIDEFERLTQNGAGYSRQQGEGAPRHRKDDLQLTLNVRVHTLTRFNDVFPSDVFFSGLQSCYDDYTAQFSILKDSRIRGTAMKMQRTDPGGGYHVWHSEQTSGEHVERALVYMLYLNTLENGDGGETEFLYQRRRVRPEANTMLVWPAGFTHAHRGNTVLGARSKYIITGWFYYE